MLKFLLILKNFSSKRKKFNCGKLVFATIHLLCINIYFVKYFFCFCVIYNYYEQKNDWRSYIMGAIAKLVAKFGWPIVKKYYKQIMQFIGEGWAIHKIIEWIKKHI